MKKGRLDALNKIIKIKNKMEFFDIEKFFSLQNCPDKTYTYQLFFNFRDIVKEKNPGLSKDICMLTPIIPDKMINQEYMNCVYHASQNP